MLEMKHFDNIIKYLAFLRLSNDISITIGGDPGVHTVCTVDTSYAPNGADYKSITGATSHMASNIGSMLTMSTKQTICADSSMST